MGEPGYFTIPDKRIVLEESTDIIVRTGPAEDDVDRLWGDRWDHLDGVTLTVYRDGYSIATYAHGEWKGVWSFGSRVETPEDYAEVTEAEPVELDA